MYKPMLAEMEAIITFDRSNGTASIYTADPVVMRRLDSIANQNPALAMLKTDETGRWYECPKSWVKVQKPRQVSEETRAKLAQYSRERAEHEQQA